MPTPRKKKTKQNRPSSPTASSEAKQVARPQKQSTKKAPASAGKKKASTTRKKGPVSKAKPITEAKPQKKQATSPRPASPAKTRAQTKAARGKPMTVTTPKPQKPPKPPKPPREPKPPRKPRFDPEIQRAIREALTRQRDQLVSVVKSAQAQMAERVIGLSDPSDQASEGYGGELAVGLMAIEAAQLDEIEAAINRIDTGTFGLCLDCRKPIPKKRIEVLPFARRCLACEGLREHRARTQGSYVDDDL